MMLRKKVAEGRKGKENVETIKKWCKEGDEETKEVLREGAEAKGEKWAFMRGEGGYRHRH